MSKGLHIHTKVYIVVVDLTKSSSIAALHVVHTHIHTHTAEAGKVERKCCEKGQKTHMPYKLTHTMLFVYPFTFRLSLIALSVLFVEYVGQEEICLVWFLRHH